MKRLVWVLSIILAVLLCLCFLPIGREGPQQMPDPNLSSDPVEDAQNPSGGEDNPAGEDDPGDEPADDPEDSFVPPQIHPDTVGIYIPTDDGTRDRRRITEFTAKRTPKKDIDCFEILASREDVLTGSSFSQIWNAAWNTHSDTQGAKIGFIIAFSLPGGANVRAQILKPGDSSDFFEYLEVYLYDDVHQTPGGWYSHLEDGDMREETVITSIKLTAGSQIAQVGDIYLTAFVYQGEDSFDERGEYCGEVFETICISEA